MIQKQRRPATYTSAGRRVVIACGETDYFIEPRV